MSKRALFIWPKSSTFETETWKSGEKILRVRRHTLKAFTCVCVGVSACEFSYLFVYTLPVSVYACLCLCLLLCLPLCLRVPVCIYLCMSVYVSVCLCMPVRGCVWGALSRETIESLIGVRAAALQGEGQLWERLDRASKASQGAGEGNSQRPPLPTFPLPAHNHLAHPALHPNVPSKPQNPETELFMHIAPCEARSQGAQGHRASRVQWGAGG